MLHSACLRTPSTRSQSVFPHLHNDFSSTDTVLLLYFVHSMGFVLSTTSFLHRLFLSFFFLFSFLFFSFRLILWRLHIYSNSIITLPIRKRDPISSLWWPCNWVNQFVLLEITWITSNHNPFEQHSLFIINPFNRKEKNWLHNLFLMTKHRWKSEETENIRVKVNWFKLYLLRTI